MRCSIIINNYNYARYLGKAIESALEQTFDNCEVIVVDDGSTDASVEVIQSYGDRIIPVLKPNGGQASAMNAGFEKCSGDLVLFLDADDWLEPNAVECIVAAFQEGTSHVYYQMTMRNPEGEDLGRFQLAFEELDAGVDAWNALLQRGAANFPPTSANAFSRQALEAVLPIPEEIFRIRADVYLLHTAAFQGGVVALEKSLANYLVHGSNNWFAKKGTQKTRKFRRPGLNRSPLRTFQRGLLQATQKYDFLERGRQAKHAEWGPAAKERWARLCWRRILSLKCLSSTHPFEEDSFASLAKQLTEWHNGQLPLGLRLRLLCVRWMPAALIRPFYFSKP